MRIYIEIVHSSKPLIFCWFLFVQCEKSKMRVHALFRDTIDSQDGKCVEWEKEKNVNEICWTMLRKRLTETSWSEQFRRFCQNRFVFVRVTTTEIRRKWTHTQRVIERRRKRETTNRDNKKTDTSYEHITYGAPCTYTYIINPIEISAFYYRRATNS